MGSLWDEPADVVPGARDLQAELGAEPPPGVVDVLDEQQLEVLAAHVRAAKRRQSSALDCAQRDALRHLPRILRGTVQRTLT
jgi:hypothetical protein